MGLIDSIIGAESGGDATAKNPNSSATGAGQFIDSTWLDTISRARPDLVQGKTQQEILALRNDPDISRQMTEAYAAQNGERLSKAGHPVTPGTTYLAHFAGPDGAISVLNSDPSRPVSAVLSRGAMEANPFLQKMTVGDLRAWADRKMGGAQPAPASPVAAPMAAPAAPPAMPLSLAPQAPPIFAQPAPQAQPQQQSQQQAAAFEIPPPMQMAPIFAAQRRSPDLSKLRAAFKAPVFSRG